MKRIIIIVLLVIAVFIAVVLILASMKPDTFHVERSVIVKSSPSKIFPLIADFHKWNSWSPYEKLDPSMKRTFSGAEYGKGAVYAWEGNFKAGAGRMEIMDTTSFRITIKLDFISPFEGHNMAEFILEPEGENTKLTWSMHGPNRFIGKIIHVFFGMDQMVGKVFETGLSNIKSLTEK
jgi:hypothetical protein